MFIHTPLTKPSVTHHVRYEKVLGTTLELAIRAINTGIALRAEAAILIEIDRLEGIYSRFLPGSELNRWQQGLEPNPSPDLAWLLRESEYWLECTEGAFNPAVEAALALYQRDPSPSQAELDTLFSALRPPLWAWKEGKAYKTTPAALSFNALAKGRIADRACAAALEVQGFVGAWVNLGGDLRHCGEGSLEVNITKPSSAADNHPFLFRLEIQQQGVATSGPGQRGHHLFNPHTLRPVEAVIQATVVAESAATADVLATALCVLQPEAGLALADRLGVGAAVVDGKGFTRANRGLEAVLKSSVHQEKKHEQA